MIENVFICDGCDSVAITDAHTLGCTACKSMMDIVGTIESAGAGR